MVLGMLDQLPAEAKTVDGIRRLMKQLCEALDSLSEGVSLAAPDTVRALLASRKEIVPVVDDRLIKCAELIRKGMRDEAASYAAEPPDLVQAATLLDISQHSRWKIWLAKLTELSIPAQLMPRMDLVANLTKAHEELIRLKPLLHAWRRMNLANASLADRIAILRKLRKADPENELWFEALCEHQKQRIPSLERDVAAAVKSKDDARLSALVAEMQQEWIEQVPTRILTAAKSSLEKFRGGRIDRELDALADSLAAARDARDLDAARTFRDRWRELEEEKGSFAVNDPRLVAALPAVAWVDAHARMETVSGEIWSSLDARPGSLRMRQEWVRSLERLGNEMEDLAEKLEGDADSDAIDRAHDRITRQRERLDRDIRFRRMMMYVGVSSVAAVVGLMVWYFDDRARFDRSVAAAVRDLRDAQRQVASGVLLELPNFEATFPSRIAENSEITSLIAMVRGELEQQKGRRSRLASALEKARTGLQAAETAERPDPLGQWPSAFAEASRSLEEIEQAKLATTDQEQADAARVKAALDRLGRKLIGNADGVCRERIAALDAELEKARDLVATDGEAASRIVETVKPAITSLRGQAAIAAVGEGAAGYASLRVASEPIISMLSPNGALPRKVEVINGLLTSRRKFRESVKELDQILGDWKPYAEQLEAIARDFTEFPEARDYARAAESKTQWQAIDEWRRFRPLLQQLHLATPEQASKTSSTFDSLSDEAKNLPMAKRVLQDVMPVVKMFAGRDLVKLRAELGNWFSGTWIGELKFVVKTEDGTIYYCLDAQQQGEARFTYVSGRKDAESGWPTKNERKVVESVEQSPQSRLADVLRAVVRKATLGGGVAVDQLFLNMLETVIAAKDVDPLLRLVTARKLLILAADYSLPFREAGRPLETLLDDGEGSIPGVTIDQIWSFVPPARERDPEYQVTKQKSEALLDEIQRGLAAVSGSMDKERKLLAMPPVGLANLVGRLGRNDAGQLVAVWRGSPPPPGQIWWFPSGGDIALAGTIDDAGMLSPGPRVGPAGTPLFAITAEPAAVKRTDQQTAAGREK
jgi:hypothetical protein